MSCIINRIEGDKFLLGNLLTGFITILVGVNLIPSIADGVFDARYVVTANGTNLTNITGASSTIIGLVPLFYVLGVLSAGIGITVGGLRNAGIM